MMHAFMQWMKRNFRWMSCREMSKVGSASWEHPPSWADRLRLKAHMIICAPCRVLRANFVLLRKAIRYHASKFEEGTAMNAEIKLSSEQKEAIKQKIRQQ